MGRPGQRKRPHELSAKQLRRFLKRADSRRNRRKLRVEPGSGGWDYVCFFSSRAAARPTWPHPTPEMKEGYLVGKRGTLHSSGAVHVDADLPPPSPPEAMERIDVGIGGYSITWFQAFVSRREWLFGPMYALPGMPMLTRLYVRGKRLRARGYLQHRALLLRIRYGPRARAQRRALERARWAPRFGTRSIAGIERDLKAHLGSVLAPETTLHRVYCWLAPDDWDLVCLVDTDRGQFKLGVLVLDTGVIVLSRMVAVRQPLPPPPPPKEREL